MKETENQSSAEISTSLLAFFKPKSFHFDKEYDASLKL
jgi:hypothetical protein